MKTDRQEDRQTDGQAGRELDKKPTCYIGDSESAGVQDYIFNYMKLGEAI